MKKSDHKFNCNGGFSLLELLIVIFIISLVAGTAIPVNFSGQDRIKLQTATNEVSTLLRYARDKAIQTTQPHGVNIDYTSNRVYGFKSGSGTDPLNGLTVLYHPISKLSTDVVISAQKHTEGVNISNSRSVFVYADGTELDYVLFDETGLPYWKGSNGIFRLLIDSDITLNSGVESQTISLKTMSGRVVSL
ncbi:MAG: Tfp pilus assembly protein FimT/FimU [Gammaproteobacteria bacterium]